MLLWVTMTAAMTAQKPSDRPRTEPSANVTAAAAVMRRACHIRGRCRRSQDRPEPAGIIERGGNEDPPVVLRARRGAAIIQVMRCSGGSVLAAGPPQGVLASLRRGVHR